MPFPPQFQNTAIAVAAHRCILPPDAIRLRGRICPDGFQGAGTVLIVDDEETIREVASAMLEDLGLTTLTAADGIEGV